MSKQTKLSENAEIYQRRKHQTEKEKLSEMSFKKKVGYLWEYYRIHAFATIAVIAIIIYAVKEIMTPNILNQLYVAIINNTISAPVLEELQDDMAEHLQLDPATEDVIVNSTFYFNGSSEYSMNVRQVLLTYVAAQEVDIIIAPESEFQTYAYNGFMYRLSDLLPTDLYSSLTDEFYITSQEEDPEETVYGIYLSNSVYFKNHARTDASDPYVIGVLSNTRHQDNSIEFIRYLFNE